MRCTTSTLIWLEAAVLCLAMVSAAQQPTGQQAPAGSAPKLAGDCPPASRELLGECCSPVLHNQASWGEET